MPNLITAHPPYAYAHHYSTKSGSCEPCGVNLVHTVERTHAAAVRTDKCPHRPADPFNSRLQHCLPYVAATDASPRKSCSRVRPTMPTANSAMLFSIPYSHLRHIVVQLDLPSTANGRLTTPFTCRHNHTRRAGRAAWFAPRCRQRTQPCIHIPHSHLRHIVVRLGCVEHCQWPPHYAVSHAVITILAAQVVQPGALRAPNGKPDLA